MYLQRFAIIVLLYSLFLTSGCMGGGDGEEPVVVPADSPQPAEPPKTTPPPKTSPPPLTIPNEWKANALPVGIWHGVTDSEGRSAFGVVTPRGDTWLLYSVIGAGFRAGAVTHGKLVTDGASLSIADGRARDETYGTLATLTAQGRWVPRQRLVIFTEVVSVPPDQGRWPLFTHDLVDMLYDAQSEKPFDMIVAAGTYTGLFYPTIEVSFELRDTGVIVGRTATGCTFTGEADPDGPISKLVVMFGGPPCAQGRETVRGVVAVDQQTGQLYAMGLNGDRDVAMMFIGQR